MASSTATPTRNAAVARKNASPTMNCVPWKWSSRSWSWGAHQMGAFQNSHAAAAAHTRPKRGRSSASASQAMTGTTHTMWWLQVMGETSRPVHTHTSTPRKADDDR